jgi:UDP-4-keto-D-QuiNAc 4-reductase
MSKILVTGATGFIGGAIARKLNLDGRHELMLALRRSPMEEIPSPFNVVGELGPHNQWQSSLAGCQAVIHCSALNHSSNSRDDSLDCFRRANVQGTLNLARQAIDAGVRRFIFLSSIKVNGTTTRVDQAFSPDDEPSPMDSYGISKLEAEIGLLKIGREYGLEVTILRLPLVYGAGVKANFLTMMRWINLGFPLPFGTVRNKRTLLYCGNLVDLIEVCLTHPAAANQVFTAGDGEDLSTTELLRNLGIALAKPARLFHVPTVIMKRVAKTLGKADMASRLLDSLRVDVGKAKALLGWQPPISINEGLMDTAREFLRHTDR